VLRRPSTARLGDAPLPTPAGNAMAALKGKPAVNARVLRNELSWDSIPRAGWRPGMEFVSVSVTLFPRTCGC